MDVETEKVPNTLAAGIKATGGEGEGEGATFSGPPAAASVPPASGEHEGGEVREGSGILPSLGWQGATAPPDRGGGAGAGHGEPEPKADDDSTPTPDQDIQSYRARLESEGHWTVAAKHYRSVLNRIANSVGAVPIALGEMGVEHIAEGAESLSRYRDQLEEINSALTIDRTGMAAWAASHEHHEEHHRREEELEAEIERLEAERDKLRAERDAVIRLCIHTQQDTGQRWSFVGNFGPVPYVSMVSSWNDKDAIAAVRSAAGLAPGPDPKAEGVESSG
jgi:cell division protein FtsB